MSGQQLRTGRLKARTRPLYCESCGVRRTIGEPKARDTWTSRLTLTPEEHDWLLVAAAEFEELSEDAQTVSNAVDFVDWIRKDVVHGRAA